MKTYTPDNLPQVGNKVSDDLVLSQAGNLRKYVWDIWRLGQLSDRPNWALICLVMALVMAFLGSGWFSVLVLRVFVVSQLVRTSRDAYLMRSSYKSLCDSDIPLTSKELAYGRRSVKEFYSDDSDNDESPVERMIDRFGMDTDSWISFALSRYRR